MRLHRYTLILFAGLSSCTTTYVPNTVQVPLFSGRGEVHAGGSINTSTLNIPLAYNIQAAASLTDHIAIMADAVSFGGSETRYQSTTKDDYKLAELAGGYYKNLNNKFRMELWAGMGIGKRHYSDFFHSDTLYYPSDPDQHTEHANTTINLQRFFIQPVIGHSSNYIDIALSYRLSTMLNTGTENRYTDYLYKPSQNYVSTNNLSHSPDIFGEASLTFKGGPAKWLRVFAQASLLTQFSTASKKLMLVGTANHMSNVSIDGGSASGANFPLVFNIGVELRNCWAKKGKK